MKKVLVTGAAGAIGLSLIKYLLAEGKYEITAFISHFHNHNDTNHVSIFILHAVTKRKFKSACRI